MNQLLFVLASETFRDLEYIVPRAICEQHGIEVETTSTTILSTWRFGYEVYHDFTIQDIVGGEVTVEEFDGIVFVWGLGVLDFIENEDLKNITLSFHSSWKLIAAICAAPRVLLAYGILDGKQVIGNDWDGNFGEMCSEVSACYMGKEKWVQRDGNVITAYGPEVVESFWNEVVEYFK